MKNTVVVNLFAGPGAGKSTCAWEIASKLKKLGYVAEYVSEYAKELVWDEKYEMLDGTLEHQSELLKEQQHRQNRLMGKVDFIVTDSPTILNLQYLKEDAPDYVKNCIKEYKKNNNFSIFIARGKEYEQAGRIHSEAEAKEIDRDIKNMLRDNDIFFGTYIHETIDICIENIIRTYERTNQKETKHNVFDIQDGVLLKVVDKSITEVTIPNGVIRIGNYAFEDCTSLKSVTMPNSLISIDDSAFYDCTSLSNVTIPDSVTNIGDWVFYGCKSLTSITIPESVISIGDYAFYNCTSLSNVTIPNSLNNIGYNAFSGCPFYEQAYELNDEELEL